jgi:hypothetical protein
MKHGGNTLSEHAFGNAIDINPDRNPFSNKTNLPANISDMAAKHGLTWGGDWQSGSRDPMHFELTGAPGRGRGVTLHSPTPLKRPSGASLSLRALFVHASAPV